MLCLATLLATLLAVTTAVDNDTEIKSISNTNYTGIEQSLFSNKENLVNLSQAFFPTNRQESISVEVKYMFKLNETTYSSAQYRWLSSPINLLVRSDLLIYLSLTIYNIEVRHVTITLDPIQGFEDEDISSVDPNYICRPDNVTGHHLLNNLTTNVS